MSQIPGILKGLKVTFRTMMKTLFPGGIKNPVPKPSSALTVQYPHEKEAPPLGLGVLLLSTKETVPLVCFAQVP